MSETRQKIVLAAGDLEAWVERGNVGGGVAISLRDDLPESGFPSYTYVLLDGHDALRLYAWLGSVLGRPERQAAPVTEPE